MIEVFGALPDGQKIHRITLTNGTLTACFLTYGAVLQDLRIAGVETSMVLGYPTFDPYLEYSSYFGATVGRCANRIQNGMLRIGDEQFQLDRNFLDKHCLHGGRNGLHNAIWSIEDNTETSVTLKTVTPDGQMGFPGDLTVRAKFSLDAGVLDIRYSATTTAPTVCNLAHHSYFNLDGTPTLEGHKLRVRADHYLPVDETLIPTGEVAPVRGTDFDFTEMRCLGAMVEIDHNFCLSGKRTPLRPVATLVGSKTGVHMVCRTTEAGLQIYGGRHLNAPIAGHDGRKIGPFGGLAMEPQNWPDAPHNPAFPQMFLTPGETYAQHSQFAFSRS